MELNEGEMSGGTHELELTNVVPSAVSDDDDMPDSRFQIGNAVAT